MQLPVSISLYHFRRTKLLISTSVTKIIKKWIEGKYCDSKKLANLSKQTVLNNNISHNCLGRFGYWFIFLSISPFSIPKKIKKMQLIHSSDVTLDLQYRIPKIAISEKCQITQVNSYWQYTSNFLPLFFMVILYYS